MRLINLTKSLLWAVIILMLAGCATTYSWRDKYDGKILSGNWEDAYLIVESETIYTNLTLNSIGVPDQHNGKLLEGGYRLIGDYIDTITEIDSKQPQASFDYINARISTYNRLGGTDVNAKLLRDSVSSLIANNDKKRTVRFTKYPVKQEYDDFRKLTKYTGSNLGSGYSSLFLRAWKNNSVDKNVTYQIYVSHAHEGDWAFYNSAYDSDGKEFSDVTKIDTDASCHSSRREVNCTLWEDIGIGVSRRYLEEHIDNGILFKLYGKGGDVQFSISSGYIEDFLYAVDKK